MARSVLLWLVLVIALAGAACTQPSRDGAGGQPAAPADPGTSAAPPAVDPGY